MATIEKIMLAAFGLIGLYVFLNADQAGFVIAQIGQNTGGLFGVLQGGNVQFPALTNNAQSGVSISRPASAQYR
jgi:hypothetical protein